MSTATLQELIRDHREDLTTTPECHAILRALARCRTAAAGTHTVGCTHCGHLEVHYNSCRNRHCPCCQYGDRMRWVAAREAELLPVPYFHVVCTVPHELLPLAREAPRWFYGALMQCSRQALADLCANPKHLGATPGQVQVLHTWSADLRLHPHVHTIVTGGGLDAQGRWVDGRVNRKNKRPFLVPVAALRKRFRTLIIQAIKRAYWDGSLQEVACLPDPCALSRLCAGLCRKKWVVYAKRPFHSPEYVIRYLGRYTHRVALHPGRLSVAPDGGYCLSVKNRSGTGPVTEHLTGLDLLGRLVQHFLPKHFRRIRMAGFLAPRVRRTQLARAREQLAHRIKPAPSPDVTLSDRSVAGNTDRLCPHCGHAMMVTSLIKPRRGGQTPLTIIPLAYQRLLAANPQKLSLLCCSLQPLTQPGPS